MVEATFKEFKFAKDADIDTAELEKFLDKSVVDPEWKSVMQEAIKTCKTKTDAKAADIVKKMEAAPFNVKKDQCNAKFDSFIVCLKTEAFVVRNRMNLFELLYNFNNFSELPQEKVE